MQYDRYGRINVLYNVLNVPISSFLLAHKRIPIHFVTLFLICCTCFCQLRFSSIMTPRNFILSTCSIDTPSIFTFTSLLSYFLFFEQKTTHLVFLIFKESLLHLNHSCILLSSIFRIFTISLIFLPEIRKLVSSANNILWSKSD